MIGFYANTHHCWQEHWHQHAGQITPEIVETFSQGACCPQRLGVATEDLLNIVSCGLEQTDQVMRGE